jgi:hypothetical protein
VGHTLLDFLYLLIWREWQSRQLSEDVFQLKLGLLDEST